MRQMFSQRHKDIVVCYHTKETPNDSEWEEFLQTIVDIVNDGSVYRTLVFSDGGGPSIKQRKRGHELAGKKQGKVAIVSHSVVVRGIATAISWLGVDLCSFAPEKATEALAYIKVTEDEKHGLYELASLAEKELGTLPHSCEFFIQLSRRKAV